MSSYIQKMYTHDQQRFMHTLVIKNAIYSHYFCFILMVIVSFMICTCAYSLAQPTSTSQNEKHTKTSIPTQTTSDKTTSTKKGSSEAKTKEIHTSHKKEHTNQTSNFRQGPSQADSFLRQFFDLTLKSKSTSSTLKRAQKALKTVLEHPKKYRFQLIVTEVDPKTGTLTPHEYRVDHEYLYPASAVKTFASLASLMYFNQLNKKNRWISIDNPLGFHAKRCVQADASNIKGEYVTLLHEIKKTQLVSSNKAFNRVFKVVGSEKLHDFLLPHFPSLRVYHRLSSNETHEESLRVPPIKICQSSSKKKSKSKRLRKSWMTLSGQNAPNEPLPKDEYTGFGDNKESMQKVGQAYIDFKTKKMMHKPMDFRWKNRVSLYDFQLLTAGIYQPQKTYKIFGRTFSLQDLAEIKPQWLNQLRKAMVLYPRQSKNPLYESARLSETRFKPLMRGLRLSDSKTKPSGEGRGLLSDRNLYYLNKAGKALGFHVDNALIVIGKGTLAVNKKSFQPKKKQVKSALYVTVGLYVNKDQVLNDNKYEYSKISVPLLDAIGYASGLYLQNPARIKR